MPPWRKNGGIQARITTTLAHWPCFYCQHWMMNRLLEARLIDRLHSVAVSDSRLLRFLDATDGWWGKRCTRNGFITDTFRFWTMFVNCKFIHYHHSCLYMKQWRPHVYWLDKAATLRCVSRQYFSIMIDEIGKKCKRTYFVYHPRVDAWMQSPDPLSTHPRKTVIGSKKNIINGS